MTIGVLHAYRRRGIGRKLLTQLLESAAARKDVKVIYLHVQTGNDVARDFYVQFGFREIGVIRGYYKRIQPDSCYVLARRPTETTPQYSQPGGAGVGRPNTAVNRRAPRTRGGRCTGVPRRTEYSNEARGERRDVGRHPERPGHRQLDDGLAQYLPRRSSSLPSHRLPGVSKGNRGTA